MPVLAGVDGCKAGWIAAIDGMSAESTFRVFAKFADLCEELLEATFIVVDIPIGLPDRCHGGRGPEREIRPLLKGRTSSVFDVPSRDAVYHQTTLPPEVTYREAYALSKQIARQSSEPSAAFARQGFGLFPKIREVDIYLRADTRRSEKIVESHPELAFWQLNGRAAMSHSKKKPQGFAERRNLLIEAGFAVELLDTELPPRCARDDLLDACAMLTVARRLASGAVERFPADPPRDRFGLPIAIHV